MNGDTGSVAVIVALFGETIWILCESAPAGMPLYFRVVDSPDIVTGSAYFHLLARTFKALILTRDGNRIPVEEIRFLRQKGFSLAEIARQAGTSVPIVRRVVGKLDRTARGHKQEDVARRVHALGGPWLEQAAAW